MGEICGDSSSMAIMLVHRFLRNLLIFPALHHRSRHIPDVHQTYVRHMSDIYQMSTRHMSDIYQIHVWYLSGTCLVPLWYLSDRCLVGVDRCLAGHLTGTWQLSDNHLTGSTRHLSGVWRERWCTVTPSIIELGCQICPITYSKLPFKSRGILIFNWHD